MGRISRVGDRYLRRLLVIGMTSLVRRARIQPASVDLRLSAMQARKPQSGHRGRRQPDGARGLSDHDARRNLPGADHYRSLIWSGREGAGRSPVARAMRCEATGQTGAGHPPNVVASCPQSRVGPGSRIPSGPAVTLDAPQAGLHQTNRQKRQITPCTAGAIHRGQSGPGPETASPQCAPMSAVGGP